MKKLYLSFALILFSAVLIFSQEVFYNEVEVSFESKGFKLYATLTLPLNSGKDFFSCRCNGSRLGCKRQR